MDDSALGTGNMKAPDRSSSPNHSNLESSNGGAQASNPGVGFRRHNAGGVVTVQPARAEDLQPRYAQQLPQTDDNPVAHSWYTALSKFLHANHNISLVC